MYFRCPDCFASTWVELCRPPKGLAATVACGQCQRQHKVRPNERLGTTAAEHHRLVREFAGEYKLDPPSAYAVLLGVMSPQQADVMRASQVSARTEPEDEGDDDDLLLLDDENEEEGGDDRSASKARADVVATLPVRSRSAEARKSRLPNFDLAFTKAIAAGHLNVQQAIARGDRDAFAARLVRRHRLPRELAYRVADNRMKLQDALAESRRARATEAAPVRAAAVARPAAVPTESRSWTGILATSVFVALCLGIVSWATWKSVLGPQRTAREVVLALPGEPPAAVATASSIPPAPEEVLRAATEVRTDALGRVIEIEGPDPASVLRAFCSASRGLQPLEITSTAPAVRDARLGVFADADDPARLYAIRIRKNHATRRWIADSGGAPVQVTPAPELPPQAARVRLN